MCSTWVSPRSGTSAPQLSHTECFPVGDAPDCDGTGNIIAVKLWWADKVGTPRFVVSVRP